MVTRWLGVVMLTAALALPSSVQAAGHGGGHGGGFGGGHGGYGGHGYGGYGHSFGYGGYGRGYGGYGWGGYGWGGYGYGLGYYPSYGYSYPYNYYYTAPYSYGYSAPQIYTEPYAAVPSSTVPAQDSGTPGTIVPASNVSSSNAALIEVRVPANAEVFVDGNKTQQTGATRLFESPPLKQGSRYAYEVEAKWMDNGKMVEQKRKVVVQAGERSQADFLQPVTTTNPASR